MVVLFPQRYQVYPKDWKLSQDYYRLNAEAFDLELPNRNIVRFCNENNLCVLDPLGKMREYAKQQSDSLYIGQGNMHWNENGHAFMAAFLKDAVEIQRTDSSL